MTIRSWRRLVVALLLSSPLAGGPALAAEPAGDLTLADARSATLAASPELAVSAEELRAREGSLVQAGLRPNPAVHLELEDFAGGGEFRGVRGSQTTLQVGQLVELGGKRGARTRVAAAERDLARVEQEAQRAELLAATTRHFVDVLAAQESLALADEAVRVARVLSGAADARLRAGGGSPGEDLRARAAVSAADAERREAERALATARLRLVASWGATEARFARAVGALRELPDLPPLDALLASAAQGPALARWPAEVAARDERLRLARAQGVPDVTLAPGVRWHAGPDEAAFLVSAAVPLPLWNRNQGAVAEADARAAKAALERRAAELRVRSELAAAHAGLVSTRDEITALRRDALPASAEGLRAVRDAYRAGRLGWIDVLDAERADRALREREVRVLAEHHRLRADVERLAGEGSAQEETR